MSMTHEYDLSPQNIRRTLLIRQRQRFRKAQKIEHEAVNQLGPDMAVAQMVLRLGGAVQFQGATRWVRGRRSLKERLMLPRQVRGDSAGARVESIDFSNTPVMYEGLASLRDLLHLKHLVMRNCAFVDDHCLGLLHHVRRTLLYLDLSHCPHVSARGLATLWSLVRLRRLVLEGAPPPELAEDRELACVLLEERNTDLLIDGVDYEAALQRVEEERRVEERASAFRKRLEAARTPAGAQESLAAVTAAEAEPEEPRPGADFDLGAQETVPAPDR